MPYPESRTASINDNLREITDAKRIFARENRKHRRKGTRKTAREGTKRPSRAEEGRNATTENVKKMLDKPNPPCYNTQALRKCEQNIAE